MQISRIAAVLAALPVAMSLAACAPDFTASPNAIRRDSLMIGTVGEAIHARIEETKLVTDDGAALPARIWQPIMPSGQTIVPRAVIVALHGMNDYSNAFALPAEVWAGQGILTYAYDQRGFGSNPYRGRWPGSRVFCQDLATAIRLAQKKWPNIPVYALGESMGAAVVLDAMGGKTGAERPHPAGIIVVAPAVYARATMPVIYRLALWLGSRLIPAVSFTGAGLHVQASDNIKMLIALGRDPKYIRGTRTDTIYGLVDLMDEAFAAKPDPALPVLLMYGAKDQVIPKTPMRDFLAGFAFARPDFRMAYYMEGWHLLLRDLEYRRVADDVSHWVTGPKSPLPSAADQAAVQFFARKDFTS